MKHHNALQKHLMQIATQEDRYYNQFPRKPFLFERKVEFWFILLLTKSQHHLCWSVLRYLLTCLLHCLICLSLAGGGEDSSLMLKWYITINLPHCSSSTLYIVDYSGNEAPHAWSSTCPRNSNYDIMPANPHNVFCKMFPATSYVFPLTLASSNSSLTFVF